MNVNKIHLLQLLETKNITVGFLSTLKLHTPFCFSTKSPKYKHKLIVQLKKCPFIMCTYFTLTARSQSKKRTVNDVRRVNGVKFSHVLSRAKFSNSRAPQNGWTVFSFIGTNTRLCWRRHYLKSHSLFVRGCLKCELITRGFLERSTLQTTFSRQSNRCLLTECQTTCLQRKMRMWQSKYTDTFPTFFFSHL